MTVTAVYADGSLFPPEQMKHPFLERKFLHQLDSGSILSGKRQFTFHWKSTECALLAAAWKCGTSYQEERKNAEIVHVFPFSSETKNMTTLLKQGTSVRVYTKGSPEKILSMCSIPAEERRNVETTIANFQKKASRVIAFAHRTWNAERIFPHAEKRSKAE